MGVKEKTPLHIHELKPGSPREPVSWDLIEDWLHNKYVLRVSPADRAGAGSQSDCLADIGMVALQ